MIRHSFLIPTAWTLAEKITDISPSVGESISVLAHHWPAWRVKLPSIRCLNVCPDCVFSVKRHNGGTTSIFAPCNRCKIEMQSVISIDRRNKLRGQNSTSDCRASCDQVDHRLQRSVPDSGACRAAQGRLQPGSAQHEGGSRWLSVALRRRCCAAD